MTREGWSRRAVQFNPFSATKRDSRHQNKVKVKGLGRNSSYLAGFSISSFFFHGSMKKFNQLAKKKLLKNFPSTIKTKVAIKFLPPPQKKKKNPPPPKLAWR